MINTNKQFMQEFEQMKLNAEARALSKISLERPLTNEEFNRYKEVCTKIMVME